MNVGLGKPTFKQKQIEFYRFLNRLKGALFVHFFSYHGNKNDEKNGVRKNDWTLRQYVNLV